MKVVSPYKPIEPYTPAHIELARRGFDWLDALSMLRRSAFSRAGIETFAITDTDLPVPHYRYQTSERFLMTWIIEVSLSYIESSEFDQDTVMISPDSLVLGRLDLFDGFDIGIIARGKKFAESKPLLNGMQFWPIASKDKLIPLYRQALEISRTLSDDEKMWGADTTPLVQLLGPVVPGLQNRNGILVMGFMAGTVMKTIGKAERRAIEKGIAVPNDHCNVLDFKYLNKAKMRPYFERVFGS